MKSEPALFAIPGCHENQCGLWSCISCSWKECLRQKVQIEANYLSKQFSELPVPSISHSKCYLAGWSNHTPATGIRLPQTYPTETTETTVRPCQATFHDPGLHIGSLDAAKFECRTPRHSIHCVGSALQTECAELIQWIPRSDFFQPNSVSISRFFTGWILPPVEGGWR